MSGNGPRTLKLIEGTRSRLSEREPGREKLGRPGGMPLIPGRVRDPARDLLGVALRHEQIIRVRREYDAGEWIMEISTLFL
jgi:hypothetical protein